MDKKKTLTLKEAIIKLYLDVKVRTNEEVMQKYKEQLANYNQSKYETEKTELMGLSSFVLIDYIRSSFEVLTNMREEISSASRVYSGETDKNYEEIVRELEKEAREHVRIEQQLRLYIETLQNKLEEMEAKNKELDKKIASLEEKLRLSMISIKELKRKTVEEVPKYTNKTMEDNSLLALHNMKRISELAKKVLLPFSLSHIEH